ncbi:hypothetical protein [Anaerofustis stercorihominis]|uniref:Uncharacterized protein n=1 Tax=Anaerofustis stercorihominis DSM 17244 TaxID=445971 RepID=B1C8G0_9FIRM|nr:hypothetical protein [Anaerofustis stercorihominis]EDS73297.1 hypothetical protein ANASTE_01017 [Anaerofustis stercorihominis DSM 17244]MCQ4794586.1 hypothetical protein [Anaerofustis stercorihominis]
MNDTEYLDIDLDKDSYSKLMEYCKIKKVSKDKAIKMIIKDISENIKKEGH